MTRGVGFLLVSFHGLMKKFYQNHGDGHTTLNRLKTNELYTLNVWEFYLTKAVTHSPPPAKKKTPSGSSLLSSAFLGLSDLSLDCLPHTSLYASPRTQAYMQKKIRHKHSDSRTIAPAPARAPPSTPVRDAGFPAEERAVR